MNNPGALDALINEGLNLQHTTQELDHLVHQGIPDLLGTGDLSGGVLPPYHGNGQLHMPAILQTSLHLEGGDVCSNAQHANASGGLPPKANFTRDVPASEDEEVEQDDDDDDEEDGADNETCSSGAGGRPLKRRKNAAAAAAAAAQRPKGRNMSGRFSGRLENKGDEKQLAEECKKIGKYLCADESLNSLATIIRAVASGAVREHLEKRETDFNTVRERVHLLENVPHADAVTALHNELVQTRADLQKAHSQIAAAQNAVAGAGSDSGAGLQPTGGAGALLRVPSASFGQMLVGQTSTAANTLASTGVAQPQILTMSVPIQQTATVLAPQNIQAVPSTTQALAVQAGTLQPTTTVVHVADVQQQQQQQQQQALLAPAVTTQPVGASTVQVMIPRVPSSAQLLQAHAAAAPPLVQSAPVGVKIEDGSGGNGGVDTAATAAGTAATNLNEQAQVLAVQATIHAQAKTEAQVHAQHLTNQAQQHAQASLQATQQAEQLKMTLMSSTLPTTEHAQQAVATVQNLEARAQAHASYTNHAFQQARDLQEKAQVHENEEIKAFTQATVLQAHANSLHVSAQQMHPQQQQQVTVIEAASGLPPLPPPPVLSGDVNGAVAFSTGTEMPPAGQQQQQQSAAAGLLSGGGGGTTTGQDVGYAHLPTTPHSHSTNSGAALLAATMPMQVPATTLPTSIAPVQLQQQQPQQVQVLVQQQQPVAVTAAQQQQPQPGQQIVMDAATAVAVHQAQVAQNAAAQQQLQAAHAAVAAAAANAAGVVAQPVLAPVTTSAAAPTLVQQPIAITTTAAAAGGVLGQETAQDTHHAVEVASLQHQIAVLQATQADLIAVQAAQVGIQPTSAPTQVVVQTVAPQALQMMPSTTGGLQVVTTLPPNAVLQHQPTALALTPTGMQQVVMDSCQQPAATVNVTASALGDMGQMAGNPPVPRQPIEGQ